MTTKTFSQKGILRNILFVTIFFLSIFFNACNTKVITPTHIPADATFVLCADMKSITTKAVDWKNIWQSDYFSNALGLKDAGMLEQIMQSGLDYQKNIYFFSKSVKDDILPNYLGIYAHLTSDAGFEKGLKKIFESQKQTWNLQNAESRKYVIAEFARQRIWIGWGGNQLFIFSSQTANNANDLTTEAKKMLNLKQEEALEQKNTDFKNVLSKNFDIAYWYNNQAMHGGEVFDGFAKNITSYLFLGKNTMNWAKKSTELVNTTTGTIIFEKGEAKGNTQIQLNDKVLPTFDGLLKPSFDENLAKNLPIDNLAYCSALAIAPKGVQKTAGEWGLLKNPTLKGALFLLGMNEEEMFNIFAGDVIIALDGQVKKDGDMGFHFLASWKKHQAINDAMDMISGTFSKFIDIKKQKQGYSITTKDDETYYLVEKENLFYITNKIEAKEDFLQGKQFKNEKILNVLRNQVGATYIDVAKMAHISQKIEYLDMSIQKFQKELTLLESVEMQAPKLNGNVGEINFSLKSIDKNRNILASLVELMTKIQKMNVQ